MKNNRQSSRIFAYPYLLWLLVFIVAPLGLILYYSFTTRVGGRFVLTLDNYIRFLDPVYLKVLLRSLWVAIACTAICLLMGYPAAYILATGRFRDKSLILFLFILPMWMNFLLRTYAWLAILETGGLVHQLLSLFKLEIQLLYNEKAVMLGMVYNYLPFMILPIHSSLKKNRQGLVEAAKDLGANNRTVFRRVIFPLSLPGVLSGIIMVFTPAVTTFVISNLLGGNKHVLIGNIIEQQFTVVNDWHFGSAISVIVMLIILLALTGTVFAKSEGEGGILL